ncbi:hypothetical protein VQ643_14975 [Pseudomonas sp. F1_0610]
MRNVNFNTLVRNNAVTGVVTGALGGQTDLQAATNALHLTP